MGSRHTIGLPRTRRASSAFSFRAIIKCSLSRLRPKRICGRKVFAPSRGRIPGSMQCASACQGVSHSRSDAQRPAVRYEQQKPLGILRLGDARCVATSRNGWHPSKPAGVILRLGLRIARGSSFCFRIGLRISGNDAGRRDASRSCSLSKPVFPREA